MHCSGPWEQGHPERTPCTVLLGVRHSLQTLVLGPVLLAASEEAIHHAVPLNLLRW